MKQVAKILKNFKKQYKWTIAKMADNFLWQNNKFYSKIVNGYKYNGQKKYSDMTMTKFFESFNNLELENRNDMIAFVLVEILKNYFTNYEKKELLDILEKAENKLWKL